MCRLEIARVARPLPPARKQSVTIERLQAGLHGGACIQDRVWTGMHEGAQALRAAARERGHVALHALSPSGSAHPFTLSAEPQDATKPPVHPRVTASHTAACAAPQKYSPVATPCAVRRARWPCRLQPRETRPDHDADAADSLESPMRVFPRTAFVAEWRFSRLEWPAGH